MVDSNRQMAGWSPPACGLACMLGEESPGSTEIRCWLMASEGDLRESATESIPPVFASAIAGKDERVR